MESIGKELNLLKALSTYEELSTTEPGKYTLVDAGTKDGHQMFKIQTVSSFSFPLFTSPLKTLSQKIVTELQFEIENGVDVIGDAKKRWGEDTQRTYFPLIQRALERLKKNGCFTDPKETHIVQENIKILKNSIPPLPPTKEALQEAQTATNLFDKSLLGFYPELYYTEFLNTRDWDPGSPKQTLQQTLKDLPELLVGSPEDKDRAKLIQDHIQTIFTSLRKKIELGVQAKTFFMQELYEEFPTLYSELLSNANGYQWIPDDTRTLNQILNSLPELYIKHPDQVETIKSQIRFMFKKLTKIREFIEDNKSAIKAKKDIKADWRGIGKEEFLPDALAALSNLSQKNLAQQIKKNQAKLLQM